MFKMKIVLGHIVFLLLLGYFLVRVLYSYESLNTRKIGISTTKQFSENRELYERECHNYCTEWVILIINGLTLNLTDCEISKLISLQ